MIWESIGFNSEQISSKNQNKQQPAEEKEVIKKVEEAIETAEKITSWSFYKKERARDDYRQEFVNYAYSIWGWDLVALCECENANWDNFRKAYGGEDSWWFCMINRKYHKDIVDTKEFWEDWKRQMNKCNELLKWGTKFYWPSRKIKNQRCSEYVKNRFTLEQNNNG